jgi:uncharacterized repeat protein (TIGR01451 family)
MPREVSVTVGQTVDQSPVPAPPAGTSRLIVTLSGTPAAARSGQMVTYTVQYANRGDAEARDAVLRVPLAAELTLISGSARLNGEPVAGAFQAGSELRVPVGHVAAGAGGTITFQVRPGRASVQRAPTRKGGKNTKKSTKKLSHR